MFLVAAGAATVAVGVGGATIAGGQDGAGPPTGTMSFKVRMQDQRNLRGINPAVPRDRERPKVADLMAASATVLATEGQPIGRVHLVDVTTFEGARRYRGGAEALSISMIDLGNDDLLFAMCRASDDERSNPCALTGGTGRFAGARGFVRDTGPPQRTKEGFRVNTVVTFIP
jgi:hypothetical protein